MPIFAARQKPTRLLAAICFPLGATVAHAQENASWRLAEQVAVATPAPVQGDGFFKIATDNPRLSGEVHVTDDGELSFRLLRNNRAVWEKPAPSGRILIPSETDIVIMIGKRFYEGKVSEGRNYYQRFTAYGAHGRMVAQIDTPVIRKFHLFPDGRLLYLAPHSIHLLDFGQSGRQRWEVAADVDSLSMLAGDSHFSTGKSLFAHGIYETALFDVNSGQRLASFRDSFDVRPHFFAVSSDGQYAFRRTTSDRNRLICNVNVYRIGDWRWPFATLQGVSGGPFVADRSSSDGNIAIGYLPKPATGHPADIEPQLEIFDAGGGTLFQYGFAPGPVDLHRSYLRFDREGQLVRMLFLSSEFRFERLTK